MPKPILKEPMRSLVNEIYETFMYGHHQWRPDLPFPESSSDMYGGIYALITRYEIKRRPLDIDLSEYYE